MKYELKEMTQGDIFSEAFNLYFDNFLALFFIAVISTIPGFLYSHSAMSSRMSGASQGILAGTLLPLVLTVLASTFSTAMMIELISKKYLHKPQTMGDYFQNILPFILPIIGLSILESFAVGIGFILLIVPGLIVLTGLSLSGQVLIIERTSVSNAMKRSWELSEGNRMQIFGFLFIMWLAAWVGQYILITLFSGTFNFNNFQSNYLVFNIFSNLLNALIAPITICILILIYFNLRIKKEGFGLEHMVDQFSMASTEPGIEA